MQPLLDRRVLLTGATGGIGAAIVEQLVQAGCGVLCHGRDAMSLASLQKKYLAYPQLRCVAADLTDAAGRGAVVDAARRFPGGINTVIHNAGWNQFACFEDQEASALEQTIQLNLTAPMLLTHQLLPMLHLQSRAQLVFITSTFGRIGHPGYAAYSAAKFGLTGFAESLRRELADSDLTVTTLSPRATQTPLNSERVVALNQLLNVQMDPPEVVAAAVISAMVKRSTRLQLGWPEKLFVRLNGLFPRMVDRAIAKQLPHIKRFARS